MFGMRGRHGLFPRPQRVFLRLILLVCLTLPVAVQADTLPDQQIERLIAQGHQALADSQPGNAAALFERVLMEQPERLGIWVDYAIALEQSGDAASARAIKHRLSAANPPATLIPWLNQIGSGTTPAVSEKGHLWQMGGEWDYRAGYDNNLNHAPNTDQITLTLPGGNLTLPLTAQSKANGGAAQLVNMTLRAARQGQDSANWLIQANLAARQIPGWSGQNYQQLAFSAAHQPDASGALTSLAYRQTRYGGQDIQTAWRASRLHGFDLHYSCALFGGLEWEADRYPVARVLDSQYLGFALNTECGGMRDWQWQARAGREFAEHARPGGDQWLLEIRAHWHGNTGRDGWALDGGYRYQRDLQGYSALLEHRARRIQQRLDLRAEYAYPLSAGWQALFSAELYRQPASLPLFQQHGAAAWLGVRSRW